MQAFQPSLMPECRVKAYLSEALWDKHLYITNVKHFTTFGTGVTTKLRHIKLTCFLKLGDYLFQGLYIELAVTIGH
jgi:hypothetical protein